MALRLEHYVSCRKARGRVIVHDWFLGLFPQAAILTGFIDSPEGSVSKPGPMSGVDPNQPHVPDEIQSHSTQMGQAVPESAIGPAFRPKKRFLPSVEAI